MKFLIMVTPAQVPLPPGIVADLLAAQKDWLNERIADGKIESVYGIAGGGGFGVANVDSHEELHEMLVGSPGFPISEFEVKAIGDLNTTIDAGIAALRRAASMMPRPPG
jgi:muconolactone delta-isomerase